MKKPVKPKPFKIKSDFALLDVLTKKESNALLKLLKSGPVAVTISGKITNAWGGYDGTSMEFEVAVSSVRGRATFEVE